MTALDVALVLLGIALGAVLAGLFLSGKARAAYQKGLREGRADADGALDTLRERLATAREEKGQAEAKREAMQEKLDGQKEEVERLQKQFAERFENLANRIFEEKSEKFTKQNKKSLGRLIDPLQKKIERFQKKVEDTHKEGLKERASLKEKIQHLTELNQQMSTQAQDLVRALEGQSKAQGDWGEMILERILEESGLEKGREYLLQESMATEDGSRVRPDVVVRLPEDRHIVIDAKVSITAYRRFVSAEGDEAREDAIAQHVASVRSHVDRLSGKDYQKLHEGSSPDFVLLFIPVEPAFAKALQADNALYNEAFGKNVVIVSPTTLLATLATIANIWKQENQSRNAQEIARRGGLLYDKFCLFAEALDEVGQRLDQTQRSYTQAMSRLQSGQGNLVRQAEMLRQLGADSSKQLTKSVAPSDGKLQPPELSE